MIYIVYNKELKGIDISKYSVEFHLIDTSTSKGKKEGLKLKSRYAAKLEPFVLVTDKEKPLIAFYSEAEDVIDSLIKYLDNGNLEYKI